MDNVFRYWQLVRLTSTGQPQPIELPTVKTWLEDTYSDALLDLEGADRRLQQALLGVWQGQDNGHDLAQMSLRCWISHQIRNTCVSLAQRYGDRHGLEAADLFPLVLDDNGRAKPTYRPLSLEILTSFDPAKASLGTWCNLLIKSHPALTRLLLEKGIYLASDWAILNDSEGERVRRILREYHLWSDFEIDQAVELLARYQAVYQRDRLRQRQAGQTGRCPRRPRQSSNHNEPVGSPASAQYHSSTCSKLSGESSFYSLSPGSNSP